LVNSLASRFPARRLTFALVRRGLLFWILARAMLLVVGIATSGAATAHRLTPHAAIALVLIVGTLGLLESRRLNEHRFFANLGVSPVATGLLVMLPALIAEIALALVLQR
jgi:hypothetical protein